MNKAMTNKSDIIRRQAASDLAVIIERMDNIKTTIENNHNENKEQHNTIMTKQDFTNGKVRALQIWRGTLAGALLVISIIAGYVITDYIGNKKSLADHETQSAINREIMIKNSENISRLEQSISDLREDLNK